jgi:hypothetical protein
MDMDFLDLRSLLDAAEVHKFRQPKPGENTEQYREALADHVKNIDFIQSEEIRSGHGWEKFSSMEKFKLMARRLT